MRVVLSVLGCLGIQILEFARSVGKVVKEGEDEILG
jgi:hypothetical protein